MNRTQGPHRETLAVSRSQHGIEAFEAGVTASRHTAHVASGAFTFKFDTALHGEYGLLVPTWVEREDFDEMWLVTHRSKPDACIRFDFNSHYNSPSSD